LLTPRSTLPAGAVDSQVRPYRSRNPVGAISDASPIGLRPVSVWFPFAN
jgi:hypothetical protein